jgi:hypothetical protein
MASSPFAFLNTKNTGRGGFTNTSRKLPATPAENLVVFVDRSQVVKVMIPFNMNRAPAIRQFCQSYLVDSANRRVLVFRKDMDGGPAWTNIALEATAQEPRLTMEPYELCVLIDAKMGMCPDVANVIFKAPDETVLQLADIERIDFLPLVGVAPEPVAEVVTVTTEDVVNTVDAVRGTVLSEMANMEARMDSKLTHLVAVVEKLCGDLTGREPSTFPSAANSASATSARKRSVAAQATTTTPTTPATSARRARTSGAGSSVDPITIAE